MTIEIDSIQNAKGIGWADARFARLGANSIGVLTPASPAIGALVSLEDVGGNPGLPAVDGSQLTGIGGGGAFTANPDSSIDPASPVVLDGATGDQYALQLDYTVNKASGNDTGLRINMIDTASPGTSLLADFQVGGTSMLFVRGWPVSTSRTELNANSSFVFSTGGTPICGISPAGSGAGGFQMVATQPITWAPTSNPTTGDGDVRLYRDAANTLALRNGTNPQTFRVYGDYTNASNSGYLQLSAVDNADSISCTISTVGNGTKSAGSLTLGGGSQGVALSRLGSPQIEITGSWITMNQNVLLNQTTKGNLTMIEQSSAPSGIANYAKIYAEDNGSGKTRLMVVFGTGAPQQIAIEP